MMRLRWSKGHVFKIFQCSLYRGEVCPTIGNSSAIAFHYGHFFRQLSYFVEMRSIFWYLLDLQHLSNQIKAALFLKCIMLRKNKT